MAALTGGTNIPSARFRIRQLIKPLAQRSIDVTEFPAIFGKYPPRSIPLRPFWLSATLIERGLALLRANRHDLVVLQRELISTLPTLERFAKHPSILDIDDAIWIHRKGLAANYVASAVDLIVCGNSFLADYFSTFGKPLVVIPTAVDTERFRPCDHQSNPRKIIGWSGTSSGYVFFDHLGDSLNALLNQYPAWQLRVVSDNPPRFRSIDPSRIEYFPWSEEEEVRLIASMDIGIMPLSDTEWSRGKCSYKMLLYMACGIPVVVSNVGMNLEVLNLGAIGFGASTPDDWFNCLETLMQDNELRSVLGTNGRRIAEQNFSIPIVANQWADILSKF